MRKLLLLIPIAGLLVLLVVVYMVGGDAGRSLLVRAVEAHGGEARYERSRIGYVKGMGKEVRGHDLPFTWEETFHLPDRMKRSKTRPTFGGMTTLTHVCANGKHRIYEDKKEVKVSLLEDEEDLIESTPDILGRLVLALRRKTDVTPLEEIVVRSRPAVGIEMDRGNSGKVRLYFDKETLWLVKMARETKDSEEGTTAVELYCSDYKDVDGIAVPHKITIFHNGSQVVEMTVTQVKYLDQMDDKVFAGP